MTDENQMDYGMMPTRENDLPLIRLDEDEPVLGHYTTTPDNERPQTEPDYGPMSATRLIDPDQFIGWTYELLREMGVERIHLHAEIYAPSGARTHAAIAYLDNVADGTHELMLVRPAYSGRPTHNLDAMVSEEAERARAVGAYRSFIVTDAHNDGATGDERVRVIDRDELEAIREGLGRTLTLEEEVANVDAEQYRAPTPAPTIDTYRDGVVVSATPHP